MNRVAVLGAGRVGRVIAADLAEDPGVHVVVADADPSALDKIGSGLDLEAVVADLGDADAVTTIAGRCDVVAVAVPGRLGLRVLRSAIRARRPTVDISFTPEDPSELDDDARRAGIPVVVDCGVAPGLSNLLVGRAAAELDALHSVRILVGGLPVRRVWPWEYRAVFSPTDVIEEYTRPARLRRHGREIVREALSETERVDLPGVGTLEAFLTDGLRSLLRTIDAPELVEKTLRWPGHAERMAALRDAGFFDDTAIAIDGVRVSPRAVTERLLFRAWARDEDDEEFTALRVEAAGERAGARERIVWDLLDRTEPATGTTSMARTTGFPCALVARLLLERRWTRAGVHPPEVLGRDAAVTDAILDGLRARGVDVRRSVDADAG